MKQTQTSTKKTIKTTGKTKEKKKPQFDDTIINTSSAVKSSFETLEKDLIKVLPPEFKGMNLGILPVRVDDLPHVIDLIIPHYESSVYWSDNLQIKIFLNETPTGKLSKTGLIKFLII